MLNQFAVKIPQEDIINDTKLKTDANAEDVCLWCNEDELNNYMDNLYANRNGHAFLQEGEYVRIQQKDIEALIQSFENGELHAVDKGNMREALYFIKERINLGESIFYSCSF